jgi:hypothetical protein
MAMGTRSDFYVGKGKDAEWIGSIAWDGYRSGIELTAPDKETIKTAGRTLRIGGVEIKVSKHNAFRKGKHLFDARTEKDFRERTAQFFANRDDVTLPEMGWPWPWDDSSTTDCSYWFFEGRVWDVHYRGSSLNDPVWVRCDKPLPEDDGECDELFKTCERVLFPNMKKLKKATLGPRSGLIVVRTG